jgi:uncharacterized protein (UPF0248 family)
MRRQRETTINDELSFVFFCSRQFYETERSKNEERVRKSYLCYPFCLLFSVWRLNKTSGQGMVQTSGFGIRQVVLLLMLCFHHRIPSTLLVRAFRTTPLPLQRRTAGCRYLWGTTRNQQVVRSSAGNDAPEPMANLYHEWTLDQDQLLWENRNEQIGTLASLLGRGLRGVETRLAKLKDPNTKVYERLFSNAAGTAQGPVDDDQKTKLVPASEVLRRIQWDASLPSADFTVLHYDRVDDEVVESPFDTPNTSITGKARTLIDALPEHRIVGVKYKERVVWDRERRLDLIFSNPGIAQVMEGYEEWKQRKDAAEEIDRQRQAQVAERLEQILGSERFALLKDLPKEIQTKSNQEGAALMHQVETYVREALDLFRQVRDDPTQSLAPSLIPMNGLETLDQLSEFVALLPDSALRPVILTELSRSMRKASGKDNNVSVVRELPEIDEDDLTETFVKGTGPGGQKVNKTSNRVVLVHNPTQLRVECQDTRSLHQNRSLARKRLQLKLDEYINGSESRTSLKAQKAVSKKAKTKARSRARQQEREENKSTE